MEKRSGRRREWPQCESLSSYHSEEAQSDPLLPASRYMLHPFAIMTMLARSSIAFSNLFLALALDTALGGTCAFSRTSPDLRD